jgi:hypothetical protein
MKNVSNIKSGLEMSRLKKIPCRTIQIEDEIKKRIVPLKGSLLTEPETTSIIRKEKKRIQRQALAIDKARLKILKKKEATTIIQAVRRGDYNKDSNEIRDKPVKKQPDPGRCFYAIDVVY